MTYKTFKSEEIKTIFEDLANLRITVFRDYPYLYEGTLEYEKEYLQTYVRSEKSFLFTVFAGDKMVGATTCIPLADETGEVKNPSLKLGWTLILFFILGKVSYYRNSED